MALAAFANGGLSLDEAIAHPRLHVRFDRPGPTVDHEDGLRLTGATTLPTQAFAGQSMYFGGVSAGSLDTDRRAVRRLGPAARRCGRDLGVALSGSAAAMRRAGPEHVVGVARRHQVPVAVHQRDPVAPIAQARWKFAGPSSEYSISITCVAVRAACTAALVLDLALLGDGEVESDPTRRSRGPVRRGSSARSRAVAMRVGDEQPGASRGCRRGQQALGAGERVEVVGFDGAEALAGTWRTSRRSRRRAVTVLPGRGVQHHLARPARVVHEGARASAAAGGGDGVSTSAARPGWVWKALT